VPAAARYLARAYALAERAREAREIIEEALGLANTQTLASLQAWCGSSLALAHLAAGAWREAEAAGAAALEHAQRHGYHPVEALALRSLALSFARRTPSELERAARLCREALSVGDKIGMRPEVAHCHADLAEIMRRSGHPAEAHAELDAALRLYRDMGMAWYIARAEAASA